MSDLNYKRRLLAAYKRAFRNRALLPVDVALDKALLMVHPLRECAIVEWARGVLSQASNSVVRVTRDPLLEWSL